MTISWDAVNAWAWAWSGIMWAIVWQSTLLAAVTAAALRLLKNQPPSMRFWLCQIVALKLLLMPFWSVQLELARWPILNRATGKMTAADAVLAALPPNAASTPEGLTDDTAARSIAAPAWYRQPSPWSWLFLVWLIVVSWQLVRIVSQWRRLHQLLRETRPADADTLNLVEHCASQIELYQRPRVVTTTAHISPLVCGIWKPVFVLPTHSIGAIQRSELKQILLHELAHLRRHDLLWCWIPELARIAYWFHPVAHWLHYRTRLERELACDQLAMAYSGVTAAEYAQTLVDTASRASRPAILRAVASANFGGGVDWFDPPIPENRARASFSRLADEPATR
jgi:beta-lactamase regulating signal transducer with metallopeptidase domain